MVKKINFVIVGASYFSSMASSMRVRNLFSPLVQKKEISVKNIIISIAKAENQLEYYNKEENVEIREVSYNLSSVLSLITFCYKSILAVKQLKQRNCDNVLYVYGYPDIERVFIIFAAKLLNFKIIFDICEDNTLIKDFKSLIGKLKNYSSIFLLKNISLIADGTCAISHHLFELLKKITKNKVPSVLIPISVDFKNFPSEVIYENPDGCISLFYGGSFAEKDGIDILLDVFESVACSNPNLKLILTGKGAKRHIDKLNGIIEKSSVKERIIMKGCLPIEEYYSVLNSCDIMCMTRNNTAFAHGGFPFKLGEFLASGKAVIASDVGDVGKYLNKNINAVLIEPGSKTDLITAIETLIANKDLRVNIGKAGRQVARAHFDNHLVTGKFISFIEQNILSK